MEVDERLSGLLLTRPVARLSGRPVWVYCTKRMVIGLLRSVAVCALPVFAKIRTSDTLQTHLRGFGIDKIFFREKNRCQLANCEPFRALVIFDAAKIYSPGASKKQQCG